MSDLKDPRWIVAKGLLFTLIVVLTGVGVTFSELWWQRLGYFLVGIWAAARWYYFCFYVLERYVGLEGRYAGMWDLICRLWARLKR